MRLQKVVENCLNPSSNQTQAIAVDKNKKQNTNSYQTFVNYYSNIKIQKQNKNKNKKETFSTLTQVYEIFQSYCYNFTYTLKHVAPNPYVSASQLITDPTIRSQESAKLSILLDNFIMLYCDPVDDYRNLASLIPSKYNSKFELPSAYQSEDPPFCFLFNGVRRANQNIGRDPLKIMMSYFQLANLETPHNLPILLASPRSQALAALSAFETFIHSNIDKFNPLFTAYLSLKSLTGYPLMKFRTQDDDPNAWLTILNQSSVTVEQWTVKLLNIFQTMQSQKPKTFISFEQFLDSPWLWTTDGSSSTSKLFIDDKLVRTKFAAAVSLSPQDIRKEVKKALDAPTDIKVFVKPDEKGDKKRLIANPSLGGYLIAAYIRYLLEQWFSSEPPFMTGPTTIDQDLQVINLIRSHMNMLPLDESKYDYHVSREAWIALFKTLEITFPDNAGVKIFEAYFQNTQWWFEAQKGQWLKGMPSGLALTSILNSLFNYAKQSEIQSAIHFALGDDALLATFQPVDLQQIAQYYQSYGSEVNANKNWQSHRYAEYLRHIYSSEGVLGYPARIYSSLIWALDTRTESPESKLNELTELWKQFYDRAYMHLNENQVAADLSRAISQKVSGFSHSVAKMWLHSPKVHGGFGRLPYNDSTFTWKHEFNDHTVRGARIRLPRNLTVKSTQLIIGKYKLTAATALAIGHPAPRKHIESLHDWEAAINNEDKPIKGPFADLCYSVIPLPSIDFVSTRAMSDFARRYHLNVFPALHGSWNRIATVLLNTSIHLVYLINQFFIANRLTIYL